MIPSDQAIALFYQLLDLPDAEQQRQLHQLQQENFSLYQQVHPLLQAHFSPMQFTQIFDASLANILPSPFDFSKLSLDKYQLEQEISRGGMGVVYAAYRNEQTFQQSLAIKFFFPEFVELLGRETLFQEAEILASLNHPYTVKVIDGGCYQNYVYIVYERVEGVTLDRYVQQHRLTNLQRLTLFQKICQAVAHAHQQGILHADLTPKNILVQTNQNPTILDFNLTQRHAGSMHQQHLQALSPEYASPEQIAGLPLSEQSDVYSLGKILALLFPQGHYLSDHQSVIRHACQSQPQKRYDSVHALSADINRIIRHRPIRLKRWFFCYRLRKLLQRRPIGSLFCLFSMMSAFYSYQILLDKNCQLAQEKKAAEQISHEMSRLLFHSQDSDLRYISANSLMELTRRRLLANPELPSHIKQDILQAMIVPQTPPVPAVSAAD